MGSGRWSTDVYRARETKRKASGASAFAYSDKARRSGTLKPHPTMDPHGVTFRESRDSAEHPTSNAIAVLFDVTGSMRKVPVELQKYLPQLLGLLLYKDYIPSPQILFGAIGDAYSDRVPLQVGQFESDNRMDEHLQNTVLEGGGGGTGHESYEMALYFMARHTSIDCYEKRRKKGYLFVIGDEKAYTTIKRDQVQQHIGDGMEDDIMLLEDLIPQVKEKYHVYHIIPTVTSHGRNPAMYDFWKEYLGEQHVLKLDDIESVAETIAMTIGMNEGTIGLDDGMEHLKEMGTKSETIETVSRALAVLPNNNLAKGRGGSLSGLDDDGDGSGGTRRL
ncbi:MAG: hypothetical protein AAF653_09165 [Chloroflexota bacterium]